MSGFTIPNTPDASNQNQAEPDSLDFQVLGNQVNGVVKGIDNEMAVTPGSGQSVNVASGEVLINGSYYTYAGGSVNLTTYGTSNFFDIVVARLTGSSVAPVVIAGNEGTNPRFPSTVNHSTDVVLAAVWRTGASAPSTGQITDKRVFVRSNTNRGGTTASGGNHGDLWVQPTTWTSSTTLESPLSVKVNNTWYKLARYDSSGNFSAGTVTATSFVGTLTGNVNGTLDGYDTSQGETGNTIAVRDSNGGLVSTYVDANNPSYTSVFSTVSAGAVTATSFNAYGDSNAYNFYALYGGSASIPDFSWGTYTNYGMYLGGNLAIGFSINGTLRYVISSSGGANASSSRYKTDIQDAEVTPTDLLDIRLTSYLPINSDTRATGVIAEELAGIESCRQFVIFDEFGNPDAVAYDRLAVAYIELLKDHEARLQALENAG